VSARPYHSAERIAENPDYGHIVCHCERVTRDEIFHQTPHSSSARRLDRQGAA
jgi:glycerol-3-phosphate dehydrogenase